MNSPQTVSVTARGVAPLVSLDAPGGILDFGTLAVGAIQTLNSGIRALHLTNTGDFLLTFRTSLTGAGYSLSGTSNCGTSLDPGATCLLVVDFSPATPGLHLGEMRIDHHADGSPHIVQLTGRGALAPILTFLTPTHSFGRAPVSGPAQTQSVTIANVGAAVFNFSAAVTEPGVSLTSDGTCPRSGTLMPGLESTFMVLFKPDAAGQAVGSLVLTDDALDSPHSLALSGIGTAPAVAFNVTFVGFPDQNVGATAVPQTVAIRNAGNQDLLISNLSAGPDLTGLALANNGGSNRIWLQGGTLGVGQLRHTGRIAPHLSHCRGARHVARIVAAGRLNSEPLARHNRRRRLTPQ